MANRCLWLLLSLVAACNAAYQFSPFQQQPYRQEPCPGNLPLSKLLLNQSDYIQYVHYYTKIPDISSFTIQYWFNLIDTDRSSTMFDYTRTGETTSTIIIQLARGHPQTWTLHINGHLVSSVISPLVNAGEWHHMVHSWDCRTGGWSVFMDGAILGAQRSVQGRGIVVPGGGNAVSGQRQTTLGDGVDRREGLEGWFTLLQMSRYPLLHPHTFSTISTVRQMASRCYGKSHDDGEIISWTRTPRKGYGGIIEAPSTPHCGHF